MACLAFWVEPEWWPEWDSAVYILLGRSLATGEGYAYLGEPFFLRPPGLPWLISRALPDGELDGLALNRLVMFFAGATVAAVYFALRWRYPRWLSLCVALLGGTSAVYVARFNRVESEFPFTALLFLGIGCFQRGLAPGPRSLPWLLASAACVAGAAHVRALGLFLVPGLFLLARRPGGRWLRDRTWIAGLAALALVAPWLAYSRLAASGSPGVTDQLMAFDYWTALTHVDPGDPSSPWITAADVVGRLRRHALALRSLVGSMFGAESAWLGGLLVAGALAGLALSLRRPSLLEWFAGGYAALLLLHGFHERLGLPLVHAVALYLLVFTRELAGWLGRRGLRRAELLPGLLAALLLAANLAHWPEPRRVRTRVVRGQTVEVPWDAERKVAQRLRDHAPPEAVILADEAPVLSVLSGRRIFTYRHPRRGNLIELYDPDLVLLDVSRYSARAFEEELERRSQRRWKRSQRLSRGRIWVYEPLAARPAGSP